MIVTRYRSHKINTSDAKTYESLDLGATVVFDTSQDDLPVEYKDNEIPEYLSDLLDEQLAPEIQRVVDSGTSISDSHIFDYYKID